eukprot:TRINITY_DN10987_c0_g1_i1.p1 TRINITY_DN10987_c0_g1~~TRINITY_DN10987_c0_g1_i1.p1  ORF type:complete len:302 (-),score=71.65 TRINITY_DN10987_c0_g1_i1:21-926(-)
MASSKIESRSKHTKYRIVRELGEAFGRVFEATTISEHDSGKRVAIKRIARYGNNPSREIQLLKEVDHPNCIKFIDWFYSRTTDEHIWLNIVFPFFPTSLADVIEEEELALNHVCEIFLKVCTGLDYLHQRGIAHRDLTPGNILVDLTDPHDWKVKISDFGSAKIIRDDELNVTYITARYYRAPELLMGSITYGVEIDIWSAICVLFEMIFRTPLFKGKTSADQLVQIVMILGTPKLGDYQDISPVSVKLMRTLPRYPSVPFSSFIPESMNNFADLLSKTFRYNPKMRLTIQQIMLHPFFHE